MYIIEENDKNTKINLVTLSTGESKTLSERDNNGVERAVYAWSRNFNLIFKTGTKWISDHYVVDKFDKYSLDEICRVKAYNLLDNTWNEYDYGECRILRMHPCCFISSDFQYLYVFGGCNQHTYELH